MYKTTNPGEFYQTFFKINKTNKQFPPLNVDIFVNKKLYYEQVISCPRSLFPASLCNLIIKQELSLISYNSLLSNFPGKYTYRGSHSSHKLLATKIVIMRSLPKTNGKDRKDKGILSPSLGANIHLETPTLGAITSSKN